MVNDKKLSLFVSAPEIDKRAYLPTRYCQIKLGLSGQGGFVASVNDKTVPIPLFQNKPRDYSACCNALCAVATFAS